MRRKKQSPSEKLYQDKDTLALETFQKNTLAEIADAFAAIEQMNDPAEKILKLLEVSGQVSRAAPEVYYKRRDIAYKYRYNSKKIRAASGVVFGNGNIRRNNIAANVNRLNTFGASYDGAMQDYSARAKALLDETVRTCALDEAAKSQWFAEAFKACEPLRDRFEAVAAARAALGDKPEVKAEVQKPQKAPQPRKPTERVDTRITGFNKK